MIFEKINIHNLFSYYGTHELDLRGATKSKNIVLISGRNGFGKTSFLNSMKLLFTGVNEALLVSVQRQRKLSQKQYVRGSGSDWFGIMNQRAFREGETCCSISAHWREDQGEVHLTRSWDLHGSGYHDEVSLNANFLGNSLTDEEINRFIDERIPSSYLPFYFFDGEQVQFLAEANRSTQMQHIEQLLNISRIESLQTAVQEGICEWRKDSMNAAEQEKLERLTRDLSLKKRHVEVCEEQIVEIDNRIADIIYDQDTVEKKKRHHTLRFVKSREEKSGLEAERKRFREDIEEIEAEVASLLPRTIAILANPHLIQRVFKSLELFLDNQTHPQHKRFDCFLTTLPADVLKRTPPMPTAPLSVQQYEFFSTVMEKACAEYLHQDIVEVPCDFAAIGINQAKTLRHLLLKYMEPERIASIQHRFHQLQQKKATLQEIESELDSISEMPPEERELFEKLNKKEDTLKEKRIDEESDKKKILSEKEQELKFILELDHKITQQAHQVKLSGSIQRRKEQAERIKQFFREYKQNLKESKRSELEKSINHYFGILMTSHRFIAHIEVSETFGLNYHDAQGHDVAMGSISAGMKQIVATALLWALKDVSGKQLPMIIDTPLARIDMNHQYRLIDQYYPNVAKQLILLPTNSEIDPAKYKKIMPHVYREYCLSNVDGNSTKIVQKPMWGQ
ncbi:MAG: DNA sulfur modification protein DndD [Mariprofundaceae bacterium]|nr:DNA sulfur modification protein DndD [Mariprofundaceae bacterium]